MGVPSLPTSLVKSGNDDIPPDFVSRLSFIILDAHACAFLTLLGKLGTFCVAHAAETAEARASCITAKFASFAMRMALHKPNAFNA